MEIDWTNLLETASASLIGLLMFAVLVLGSWIVDGWMVRYKDR